MPVAYNHIGELVSEDINQRFKKPAGAREYRPIKRGDILKVTLRLPDNTTIVVPVETRVEVEY
jgi:bifunctional DNA-binding transcriptional regulator/antitoxin component of YhaV-PrlF toxin-antitoxin module